VPRAGNVGIFNRSHYEDVLIVRVHMTSCRRRPGGPVRRDQRFEREARRRRRAARQDQCCISSRTSSGRRLRDRLRPDQVLEVSTRTTSTSGPLGTTTGRLRRGADTGRHTCLDVRGRPIASGTATGPSRTWCTRCWPR
jgi:hypothetical protein